MVVTKGTAYAAKSLRWAVKPGGYFPNLINLVRVYGRFEIVASFT